MEFENGSDWRKWDLHVHTPCSLVQEYGGDNPEAWEKFLQDLESLPPEFGAIGINDYLFIDGYRKVLAAKTNGRLPNIDLILPVIELRLDKFGGSKSHLSRVNFHVIFSDQISPDVIEHQFLNALWAKYQLSPQGEAQGVAWSGVPTRDALSEFGKKIIESVPVDQRQHYDTPIKEGFNNLNFVLQDVQKILDGTHFRGLALTAVGKAEWDEIKWNDHSIADKKNVINIADFVFIAAASPTAHATAKASLRDGGVNDRLLDCSDAHRFKSSADKDRIGNCFTWMKADLTFAGLRQTIHESADRIYVGDIPTQLANAQSQPTKFVRSLSISRVPGSKLAEPWFDGTSLTLNSGLVTVIGNKGSGKSALVDILGLLGDAPQQSSASFLNRERFNQPKQMKGGHFEAVLKWQSGTSERKRLDATVDRTAVSRVKYIPQNFFETICNEFASSSASGFDREIKDVIFSHVPPAARLGKASLSDLLDYRTGEIERSLATARVTVGQLNRQILALRAEASDEHLEGLRRQLAVRNGELEAHEARKPPVVLPPGEAEGEAAKAGSARIAVLREHLHDVTEEILRKTEEQKRLARLIEHADQANQRAANITSEVAPLIAGLSELLARIDIQIETVVQFTVDMLPIQAKDEVLRTQKGKVDVLLDLEADGSLPKRRVELLHEIDAIKTNLDEPGKQHEAYLKAMAFWEESRKVIVGGSDAPESVVYLESQIDRWSDLPVEIDHLEQERDAALAALFAKLDEIRGVYADLYRPVQDFIARHPVAKDRFRLNFDVSISEEGFEEKFFSLVSQGVAGSFCGKEPGSERLRTILDSADFDTVEGVAAFIREVESCLVVDKRKSTAEPMSLESQLRRLTTVTHLYDFLFDLEYLTPRYRLQMAGKNLDQLSPGEKGSLLLVFYLLLDQNDVPLLIDQPEENLDNQTIVSLLVPSIKEAKLRRQIIIVTHNPNIAVVCDAEQIICASHESEAKLITYIAGSIENPVVNKKVMDILEGTKPAFDNRSSKYAVAQNHYL